MQHIEALKLKGLMTATLYKEDGTVEVYQRDNIIVNVGFDFIADAIGESTSRPSVMKAIALGTGVTAATASQTTLVTELERGAATYTHTGGTKVFTFSTTFAQGIGTGAITEAGVFNSITPSSGVMLDRVVFGVINKGAGDTLQVTFSFTMS